MEEIDLKELLNYFVSKIFLMLSIVFVVLIIGFSYDSFIKVPKYKSYTTVLLTTENNTITSNDIILNKNFRKKIYIYTQQFLLKGEYCAHFVFINENYI